MGIATVKFTRTKPTANWSNISEVQTDITTDMMSVMTNTEMSIVNDWFMLGLVTTDLTYINTTSVVITGTFDEVLLSNSYFSTVDNYEQKDETTSIRYRLKQNADYVFSSANVSFSNGHSYTLTNNVFG